MKKTLTVPLIAISFLFFCSCGNLCGNVASAYDGYRVKLSTKDEVYSKFNMSIFRGIDGNMNCHEMIEVAGEPDDITREKENEFVEYYSDKGILRIYCYYADRPEEELGLITFTPFNNKTFYLSDFVYNAADLGITTDKKSFAVYVDDLLYFIVYLHEDQIMGIYFWMVKEG